VRRKENSAKEKKRVFLVLAMFPNPATSKDGT
jgi:hypothetical protein